jgi:alkylation response protein AidB-like acyl-CoA dehydrogenase
VVEVSYAPNEELALIRDTTRQFLADRLPLERVRELMMTEDGFDRDVWKELAALGWTGLVIGEDHGGSGLGMVEMGVVMEEMGRVVTPGPFFTSAVLATTAIQRAGNDVQRDELLRSLASGDTIATLAMYEQPRGWDLATMSTTATRVDGGWRLDGEKRYVLDGHLADLIVVAARVADGVGLFVVPAEAEGVLVEQVPTLDATRRESTVSFDGVKLADDALLGGGAADQAITGTLDVGVAALSCEQVGGAQRCLELSVEYAKTRHQFGRPIGSFQAVKFRCAEMLMKVEHAKSTAYHAVRVTDDPAELAIAAPLAGSVASEAYSWAAGETIQIHGGVGFTWEHDAHLYLKRARSSSVLLGDSRYHRDRLGKALGL